MTGIVRRWRTRLDRREDARRVRLGARATGALAGFYAGPAADLRRPAGEQRLLAVDLETTGLDPRRDRILSIGLVPVDGLVIDLSGARHLVVRPSRGSGAGAGDVAGTGAGAGVGAGMGAGVGADAGVGQSAVFHGLTDDALTAGVPLDDALEVMLDALAGRVLLAHHAVVEQGFLSAACREVYGAELRVPAIDTLERARLLLRREVSEPGRGELRLGACRARHGLPEAPAHHALEDALACAELYLAQAAEL